MAPSADVHYQPSYEQPTFAPMQQPTNQDPFATYGAPAPAAPQPPSQQMQQQPIAQNVDPWAAMAAPPAQAPAQAPVAQPAPAPMQAPPAPMQAPPAPAQQPQELTPPPAVVSVDASNQQPPSPMGDVSVLAASAQQPAPAMPTAMNQVQQPLQPAPQPVQAAPVAQPTMQAAPAPMAQAPAPTANPFDFGGVAVAVPQAQAQAPPPAALPPQAPPTPPQANVQPTAAAAPTQPVQTMASPPTSPVPQGAFAPQQGFADPFGYAFSPVTSPVTSPNGSPGAMVPSAVPNADPFGVFGGQVPPAPSAAPAQAPPMMPPAQPQQAVVPSQAAPSADPFGVFGAGQPAPAPANADPFGGGALVTSAAPAPSAGDDPFGVFGAPTPAAAPVQAPAQAPPAPAQEADPWAGFNESAGFDAPKPNLDPRLEVNQTNSMTALEGNMGEEKPITLDSNNLPSEGEYYEARINARSLGAMFYTSRNLEETLYRKMPQNVIEALGSRPVVAYVAENSAAYNSGVTLGHVVLSVNGQEVSDPETCANAIRQAPRPMNLRCYVPPELTLALSEGNHLVKYDSKDLEAPGSTIEWKRKYVVVGGIVTKPWMINMFYRKKDYDIAVKEAHAGHKISVKVKQFDLRGARIILKGKDGKPNWVEYPGERKPWYYITVLPNKGYPIKIQSPSVEELEPVYSAIRRFVRKDMESRYQYRMEQSLGDFKRGGSAGGSGYATGGRGGRRDEGSNGAGGFEGFGDAPGHESYTAHWR